MSWCDYSEQCDHGWLRESSAHAYAGTADDHAASDSYINPDGNKYAAAHADDRAVAHTIADAEMSAHARAARWRVVQR